MVVWILCLFSDATFVSTIYAPGSLICFLPPHLPRNRHSPFHSLPPWKRSYKSPTAYDTLLLSKRSDEERLCISSPTASSSTARRGEANWSSAKTICYVRQPSPPRRMPPNAANRVGLSPPTSTNKPPASDEQIAQQLQYQLNLEERSRRDEELARQYQTEENQRGREQEPPRREKKKSDSSFILS